MPDLDNVVYYEMCIRDRPGVRVLKRLDLSTINGLKRIRLGVWYISKLQIFYMVQVDKLLKTKALWEK